MRRTGTTRYSTASAGITSELNSASERFALDALTLKLLLIFKTAHERDRLINLENAGSIFVVP